MSSIITKTNRSAIKERKSNPFSVAKLTNAIRKQQDKELYEDLKTRVAPTKQSPEKEKVTNAINSLKQRINGTYQTSDFGTIEYVALGDLYINIDNQRDVDWDHVAHIIETFDPRAVQVVNAIRLVDGRMSVPEGQHTAVVLYILHREGIIDKNFQVQCKVVDANAVVPGSNIKGEAFGNYLFRLINYKGRKGVEPYFMHKSRVSGVRNYKSTLTEDVHANEIEKVVEANNMFTTKAVDARGRGATPGMVTYITGLNKIAGMETEDFDESINDLKFALNMHNTYFPNEKGVDGGWILAMGRYAALARTNKLNITRDWQEALMKFFKETYASPSKFHKTCKTRLEKFNRDNDLPGGWSDTCLLSILIIDFHIWCKENDVEYPTLPDKNINKYVDI